MSGDAYTFTIGANQPDLIHQGSPSWMLTFVRWDKRFLFQEFGTNADLLATRNILSVINDCASVNVSINKESHTHQMSALLYPNDINYMTAIAPGDFVLVNMATWDETIRSLSAKAQSGTENINGANDGFKGIFKIQSVRKVLSVDPSSGTKRLMYQITGFSFTEFNNVIYFNPHLQTEAEKQNDLLFITRIGETFPQFIEASKSKDSNLQDLLKFLIESFLGKGINKRDSSAKEPPKTPSTIDQEEQTHFYMPKKIGTLLGVSDVKFAKEIYSYLFGIQSYSNKTNSSNPDTLKNGMIPDISSVVDGFYITQNNCAGKTYIPAEFWNQVSVWDILNQNINSPLNELYTCFRIQPNGIVLPTVVFRQVPFTSDKLKTQIQVPTTTFLNVPRWKISPHILIDMNLGRDEAARVNFVQVFGTSQNQSGEGNSASISQQIAKGNYVIDKVDIQRSGLKPIIRSTNFDFAIAGTEGLLAPTWAKILGDMYIGGHLKLNGSITTIGIQAPIAVGDNLELDGVVYHIEAVRHNCSIGPDGKKSFTTSLDLSFGVSINSDKEGLIFSEMTHSDAQGNQEADFNRSRILPGITDEQALPERLNNDEFGTNTTKAAPFSSRSKAPPPKETDKKKKQE